MASIEAVKLYEDMEKRRSKEEKAGTRFWKPFTEFKLGPDNRWPSPTELMAECDHPVFTPTGLFKRHEDFKRRPPPACEACGSAFRVAACQVGRSAAAGLHHR